MRMNARTLPKSMTVPRFHGHLNHRKQNAHGGEKSLGALQVLLVLFDAPLQFRDPPAIAVAHEPVHLRLQDAQIAQYLCFEFIHHPHPPDSTRKFRRD
jgi:hypothetical protein